MIRLFYFLVNSLCSLMYKKEHDRYFGCLDIKSAQEELLLSMIRQAEHTEYGKAYGFAEITSAEDYQKKVPLTVYEDYLPYIEKIADGAQTILTGEHIIMLEPTSGSASASKYIPYTKTLKEQFQKGIKPWLRNLYLSYPAVKWGQSYWSVTPALGERRYTKAGIPIGFEEDSEYFGKLEQYCMNLIFVSPKNIAAETDMERFYFRTLESLLNARHLTLISVWNPTYLMLLLDYLDRNRELLLMALPDKRRRQIGDAVEKKDYKRIWKSLVLISCWADQNAAAEADKLAVLFPGVSIQPKGLLATEGFISFPAAGETGAGISYYSHYFEFRSDDGRFYPIDRLEKGRRYEVILTTGGGLYRYQIRDQIQVCGYRGTVPLVRFAGKSGKVSDLYGEKLTEEFIDTALEPWKEMSQFLMLAPDQDRYILYIQAKTRPNVPPNTGAGDFPTAGQLDELLRKNFHYDYCRRLGQLKAPRLFVLTGNPSQAYLEHCRESGQRLGDIKPSCLSPLKDWNGVFEGFFDAL